MTTHTSFRLVILALLLSSVMQGTALAKDAVNVLDRPADHIGTIFHVGLWVEDIEEMLGFLAEVMDFNIVLRAARSSEIGRAHV